MFSHFKRLETFIQPESYLLGERTEFVSENGVLVLKLVPVTADFVPLRDVLQAFFSIPDIFDSTIDYIEALQSSSEIISNFIQCSLWRRLVKEFPNKTVFPIFWYFDDYENNNPLGCHRGIAKCGAVYISIPCLPPEMQSKLENIFLFLLFNTLDHEVFKNRAIFKKALDELIFLREEGITIKNANKEEHIFFEFCEVLGDNLGLHEILGFQKSFNSDIFCRYCYTSKKDIQKKFDVSQCSLRDIPKYKSDILLKDQKSTGITEECVFHQTRLTYHVLKNLIVDVMHDVLEGVCQYDLGKILYNLIYVYKLFTVDELNILLRGHNYGPTKNKPPIILESQISNKKIILSASEMLCLMRHIRLIIGHLIPEDREIPEWDLLKELCEIVEILVSSDWHSSTKDVLRVKIRDYLRDLTIVFPGCLKPKHHFLVHYYDVACLVGPLWKLCCMRYESKHREAKIEARVSVSRVNITHTLAIKNQLKFNYRLLKEMYPQPGDKEKPKITTYCESIYNLPELDSYFNDLPDKIKNSNVLNLTNNILFEGQNIQCNLIMMIPGEDDPQFHIIKKIILHNDEFLLITIKLINVYLDEHTNLYEITSPAENTWKTLEKKQLCGFCMTHSARVPNGKTFIVKNWI